MSDERRLVHVIVGAWAGGATKETRARTACGWSLISTTRTGGIDG